jgi:aminoglycoside N3'-acetyltransferase
MFEKLCNPLKIPKQRILFLHVRLRNIHRVTGQSYLNLTQDFLKQLWLFEPKTILIPSYTFSFMRSGLFHRLFSKSEVGRFSEEVRQHFAQYRTPDPMFSVLDTTNYLKKKV